MADWDDDSPVLEENLKRLLRRILQQAKSRQLPTVAAVRQWHSETMRDLSVSDPGYVGAFRGEPGLENVQIRIGAHYGVAAPEVADALAQFEQTLQRTVFRLDELIPPGSELNTDQLAAIIKVCAWIHAEWIRIHPFVNGNGRTARLWVNSIAVRYGLPPFLPPRPRPGADYGVAGASAMLGDWEPTAAVFRKLLKDFLAKTWDRSD